MSLVFLLAVCFGAIVGTTAANLIHYMFIVSGSEYSKYSPFMKYYETSTDFSHFLSNNIMFCTWGVLSVLFSALLYPYIVGPLFKLKSN